MSSKHKEFFVLAHDAGGAEILAAYIRRRHKDLYHIYAGGPAEKVFKREDLSYRALPKRSNLKKILGKHKGATALLGTSWAHSIEFAALKEAKRQGMRTIAYLDSWLNYRERFGYPAREWRKNLPDQIWVGDRMGLALARKHFPRSRIHFVENLYFAKIITRFKRQTRAVSRRDVLYVSAAGRVSERTLADFLEAMARAGISRTFLVRLHPLDARDRYERIVRREARGLRVELSREKDIVQDLIRARVVIGPETVALVPAVMLGIKAIRIVPKGEKPFLPFPSITRARSAKAAARLVQS